jgi:hypothetical protein
MKKKLSQAALEVIKKYSELDILGKKVCTPYFINSNKKRAELRVMAGKGAPEEIIHEVKVWAQVKGFDLARAKEDQIREFMMDLGIGIDCSGFVVHVLNAELKRRKLGPLWNYLAFSNNSFFMKIRRMLRPLENIGANTLTNETNTTKISDLNNIKPADLIRLVGNKNNEYHVAIITEVEHDDNGKIKSFKYANSNRKYEDQNGVRIGTVKITDPKDELKDQKWIDDYKGKNYFYDDLMKNYEQNGIRRLKVLDTFDSK